MQFATLKFYRLLCSNSEYYRLWRYDHLWKRELNYRVVFELLNEQLLLPIYHLTYWWDLYSVQLMHCYFISFPRVPLYKALCISSMTILILYEYSTWNFAILVYNRLEKSIFLNIFYWHSRNSKQLDYANFLQ